MREYLEIGAVPCGEDCEQLGPNYRPERARAECRAFINQLRRQFGPEPEGTQLRVKSNPHDFGTYYEVACYFSDEKGAEYAYLCEGEAAEEWDDEARSELNLV